MAARKSGRHEARRLFQQEHMSLSEIAEELNVNPATIRKWKQRDNWEFTEVQQEDHRNAVRQNAFVARELSENPELNERQKEFCLHYIRTFNGKLSAQRAGYEATEKTPYRLLASPKIRDEINRLLAMKRATLLADLDSVVERMMQIAFADLADFITWGHDGRHNQVTATSSDLVDGTLVSEISTTNKGFKIKLEDRMKALEWLGNYFLANPLDRHRVEYDMKRLAIEEKRLELEKATVEIPSGGPYLPDAVWRGLMNPVYADYLDAQQPRQIFFGGSSSGKSFAILAQRTVRDILQGKRNYLICRKTARTLRHTCFNEIRKTILRMDLEPFFKINQTDMVITCKSNGCQVIFVGLNDVEKVKSITPQVGVITDIVIEEATEIEYDDFKPLEKRLRGDVGDSSLIKRTTLLFNPILQDHWIYETFFAGRWDDSLNRYSDDKLLILRTTYKDNRWLTPDDVEKLENETDKYYFDVYTLGKWGVLGNLVFTNWEVTDLTETEKAMSQFYNGLDFGFSQDPTAMIRCGYNRSRKEVYVFRELYGTEWSLDVLAEELKQLIRKEVLTCDSAEPRSIRELTNSGINATAAKKGPGSLESGIKWLQRQRILVDRSCTSTILELKKYKWREDRQTGRVLPEPVDRDNHAIDALRYALDPVMLDSQGRVESAAKHGIF